MYIEIFITVRLVDAPQGLINARLLIHYITRKLRFGFRLNKIIYPLLRGLHKKYNGLQIKCLGRFTRRQRSSKHIFKYGRIPLSTSSANIDYALGNVTLKYGACGIRIWLYKNTRNIPKAFLSKIKPPKYKFYSAKISKLKNKRKKLFLVYKKRLTTKQTLRIKTAIQAIQTNKKLNVKS